MKYPIYRKFASGEIRKYCSDQLVIDVTNGPGLHIISSVKREVLEQTCLNYDLKNSQPATRDEFEKAYGEAFFHFQKANTIL